MFGYIKPYNQELKLKEIQRYSACYCALCDQLKQDYGFLSRFILNYDVTFLLICLDYFSSEERVARKIRCPYNLLRVKRTKLSLKSLRYAAFINYWLVAEKLKDDCVDDKSLWKTLLYKIVTSNRGYKRGLVAYQAQVGQLSDMLQAVYHQEKSVQSAADFDRTTNAFGDFFVKLFLMGIDAKQGGFSKQAEAVFFQIGKWIYIVDAFDDLQEDTKRNRFNLLFSLEDGKSITKEAAFEKTLSMHLFIKSKIKGLLASTDVEIRDDCILNIITDGLDFMFCRIVLKRYKEYKERLKDHGYSLE